MEENEDYVSLNEMRNKNNRFFRSAVNIEKNI